MKGQSERDSRSRSRAVRDAEGLGCSWMRSAWLGRATEELASRGVPSRAGGVARDSAVNSDDGAWASAARRPLSERGRSLARPLGLVSATRSASPLPSSSSSSISGATLSLASRVGRGNKRKYVASQPMARKLASSSVVRKDKPAHMCSAATQA